MIVFGAKLLLASLASVPSLLGIQDVDNPAISNLIDRLSSSQIEERDSAVKELRKRGVSVLPRLESAVGSATDPEVKARVEALLREIRVTEASALAERGDLDEALLKLAEADGTKQPATYIAERLAAVGHDMRSWYPPTDQLIHIIPDYDRQAKRVSEVHGLWGLAFLIQELGSERFEVIPTGHLLEAMGKPAVLPLVRALSSNNRLLQNNACSVLNEILAHLKRSGITPDWLDQHGPEWIQAAANLALDQEAGESVRKMAQSMSDQLSQAQRSRLVRRLLSKVPQERLAAEQQMRAEGKMIMSELRQFIAALPEGEDKSRLERMLKDLSSSSR